MFISKLSRAVFYSTLILLSLRINAPAQGFYSGDSTFIMGNVWFTGDTLTGNVAIHFDSSEVWIPDFAAWIDSVYLGLFGTAALDSVLSPRDFYFNPIDSLWYFREASLDSVQLNNLADVTHLQYDAYYPKDMIWRSQTDSTWNIVTWADFLDSLNLGEFAGLHVGRGLYKNPQDTLRLDLQSSSGLTLLESGVGLDRADNANIDWTSASQSLNTSGTAQSRSISLYPSGEIAYYQDDVNSSNYVRFGFNATTEKWYLNYYDAGAGVQRFPFQVLNDTSYFTHTSGIDYNELLNIPDLSGYITSETDPIFAAWDKSTGISITESQISDLNHYDWWNVLIDGVQSMQVSDQEGVDFLSGAYITISEPSPDKLQVDADTSGASGLASKTWVTNEGFLKNETDPVFTAWDKSTGISITESQISNLNHYDFWNVKIDGVQSMQVSDQDSIDFLGGTHITISEASPDKLQVDADTSGASGLASKTWVTNEIAAAGGGDITGVTAGSGLSGGGLSGDVTLSLDNADHRNIDWTNTGYDLYTIGSGTFGSYIMAGGNIWFSENNRFLYGKDHLGNSIRILGISGSDSLVFGQATTNLKRIMFAIGTGYAMEFEQDGDALFHANIRADTVNGTTVWNGSDIDISNHTNLTSSYPNHLVGDDMQFNYDASDFNLYYGTTLALKDGGVDWAELSSAAQDSVKQQRLSKVVQVHKDTLLYSIFGLFKSWAIPENAVLSDIKVYIKAPFNSVGSQYLKIGIPVNSTYFANNISVASIGFKTISLLNIPFMDTSGGETIETAYVTDGADPTAGEAWIYYYYMVE